MQQLRACVCDYNESNLDYVFDQGRLVKGGGDVEDFDFLGVALKLKAKGDCNEVAVFAKKALSEDGISVPGWDEGSYFFINGEVVENISKNLEFKFKEYFFFRRVEVFYHDKLMLTHKGFRGSLLWRTLCSDGSEIWGDDFFKFALYRQKS